MKSFTERSPLVIGSIVIAVIVAGTAAALFMNAGVFANRYEVIATFSDSAGLKPGDAVRVAGVRAGQVAKVEAAGGEVAAHLLVNEGVELSRDTRAAIVVETLLGQKYVRLETGTEWDEVLSDGDVIRDGETPTEVLDLQNVGTKLLEETDAAAMNEVLTRLTAVTEGKREQVVAIVDGLNAISGEVNRRKGEVASLLGAANRLSATLAGRDEELARAVGDLEVVVSELAARREELVRLLGATRSAAAATADLVGENRARLDSVLHELDADLSIVARHQIDLAHSVAYLASAIEGFASVGYSAGGHPNEWANIFAQLVSDDHVDPVLGSCGPLDQALDLALGPDPLPCEARDGPANIAAGSSSGGRARVAGTSGAPIDARTELERSMTLFLAPLLQVDQP